MLPEAKAVATEKLRLSVDVLIEAWSPLPVAATPLIDGGHVGSRRTGGRSGRLVDGAERAADGLHRGKGTGAVVGRLEDQVAATVNRGTDSGRIRDAVDGRLDFRHRGAAIEVEDVISLVATDLQHDVRRQRAAGVGQRSLRRLGVDLHVNTDRRLGAEVGLVDLQIADIGAARRAGEQAGCARRSRERSGRSDGGRELTAQAR